MKTRTLTADNPQAFHSKFNKLLKGGLCRTGKPDSFYCYEGSRVFILQRRKSPGSLVGDTLAMFLKGLVETMAIKFEMETSPSHKGLR